MMKILSVVGARPQFIKAAVISRVLRQRHREILVHTGQHYDHNMTRVFFDELEIPNPDINLGIGSLSPGAQTAAMITGIETILMEERPDWVLVYGDTISTLAGALAAAYSKTRLAHIEAGLRSFNRTMPEEINRVLTDRASDLLLCPSQTAVDNLVDEGIRQGVHLIGDVMLDGLEHILERARVESDILRHLDLSRGSFLLATVHRAENTDDPARLRAILDGFAALDEPLIFPIHPRTRRVLAQLGYTSPAQLHMIEPVGYLDMVMLEQSARMILTDSGGVQKEAYWLGVPCVTLRNETEWAETVQAGWNILVGTDKDRIVEAVRTFEPPAERPPLYGDGRAAERCVVALESAQSSNPHYRAST